MASPNTLAFSLKIPNRIVHENSKIGLLLAIPKLPVFRDPQIHSREVFTEQLLSLRPQAAEQRKAGNLAPRASQSSGAVLSGAGPSGETARHKKEDLA